MNGTSIRGGSSCTIHMSWEELILVRDALRRQIGSTRNTDRTFLVQINQLLDRFDRLIVGMTPQRAVSEERDLPQSMLP